MNDNDGLHRRLDRLERRIDRIGQLLVSLITTADRIADDVDAIDRQLRPHGDGARVPRRGRR